MGKSPRDRETCVSDPDLPIPFNITVSVSPADAARILAMLGTMKAPDDPLIREHDVASLASIGVTARTMADAGRAGCEGFVRTPKDGWTAPASAVRARLAAMRGERSRKRAPKIALVPCPVDPEREADRALLAQAGRPRRSA